MSGKAEDKIEQIIVHVSPPTNRQLTGTVRTSKSLKSNFETNVEMADNNRSVKSDPKSLEDPFITSIDQIQTLNSEITEITTKKRGRKAKIEEMPAAIQRSQSVRTGSGKQVVLNSSFASDTSETLYKSSPFDFVNINDYEIEIAKLNNKQTNLTKI